MPSPGGSEDKQHLGKCQLLFNKSLLLKPTAHELCSQEELGSSLAPLFAGVGAPVSEPTGILAEEEQQQQPQDKYLTLISAFTLLGQALPHPSPGNTMDWGHLGFSAGEAKAARPDLRGQGKAIDYNPATALSSSRAPRNCSNANN